MTTGTIGLASQRHEEEKAMLEKKKNELKEAVEGVLICAAQPTEHMVRHRLEKLGCRIVTLDFSPHTDPEGKILGGKMVQFSFRVIWKGWEILDGTIIRT